MLSVLRNLFRTNKSSSQLALGRWALNNENVKSLYANSDHCGDIICGNPSKVKTFVYEENSFKHIPINQLHNQNKTNIRSQSTLVYNQDLEPIIDVYAEQDFCCMLLGLDGPCKGCNLMKASPKINVA